MHNQIMSVLQSGLDLGELETVEERYWKLSDIRQRIKDYLECLRDHLDPYGEPAYQSEPKETALVERNMAIAQEAAAEACRYLWGPPSGSERESAIKKRAKELEDSLISQGYSVKRAQSMARTASRVSGESVGRPCTTGPNAVRALTLHLREDKTWRQIFLDVVGPCPHVCPACADTIRDNLGPRSTGRRKPKPRCIKCDSTIRVDGDKQQICPRCYDAHVRSVYRLEAFLRRILIHPEIPRWKDVQQMSPEDLDRWYWDNPPIVKPWVCD